MKLKYVEKIEDFYDISKINFIFLSLYLLMLKINNK